MPCGALVRGDATADSDFVAGARKDEDAIYTATLTTGPEAQLR